MASAAAGFEVRRGVAVRGLFAAAFGAGLAARLRAAEEGLGLPVPRPGRPRVPIGMISASATRGSHGSERAVAGLADLLPDDSAVGASRG